MNRPRKPILGPVASALLVATFLVASIQTQRAQAAAELPNNAANDPAAEARFLETKKGRASDPGTGTNQFYTVAGRAIYDSLAVGRQFLYDFTLTVSNGWWGMEFLPIPRSGVRYIQNFDGSNFVAITYMSKAAQRGWNDGYVVVDNRRNPIPEPSVAHTVFVGFAAQFYLPPGTNGLLCPLWHPEREVNQMAFVTSDWQFLAPGRPEIIQCRYEAEKWNKILHKANRNTATEDNQTALGATYFSVGKTNFAGGVFPTAYGFTGFAPDREDGQDKASPVCRIQVTNVVFRATVAKQLFDRKFKGAAVVSDYRGCLGQPLSYNITDSAPPGLP